MAGEIAGGVEAAAVVGDLELEVGPDGRGRGGGGEGDAHVGRAAVLDDVVQRLLGYAVDRARISARPTSARERT